MKKRTEKERKTLLYSAGQFAAETAERPDYEKDGKFIGFISEADLNDPALGTRACVGVAARNHHAECAVDFSDALF